jgi:WxcM-like, C-terminal
MSTVEPVGLYDDDRGRLLAVEFNELPFVPRRAFVVVAPDHPVIRGGHDAACREVIVVVTGTASIHVRDGSGASHDHRLAAGDRLLVDSDAWLSYELHDPSTTLLVLADAPYGDTHSRRNGDTHSRRNGDTHSRRNGDTHSRRNGASS